MSSIQNYGKFLSKKKCFELMNEPPRKWLNFHANKICGDKLYSEFSTLATE